MTSIVAFSHSKHRNAFGMVGIEIDDKKTAYIRLAKQWTREQLNSIPRDVKDIYDKIQWTDTYADQLIGLALIRNIESKVDFILHTITTQKNIKDPENIEKIKVMDITEMTQLLLSLKLDHKIQFPKNPTETMSKLESQVEMFTEHKTEQGNMSYYAPGDELDNLTRALMICCFAGRHMLQHGALPLIIQRGVDSPVEEKHDDSFLGELFDTKDDRGEHITSNLSTYEIFRNKRHQY